MNRPGFVGGVDKARPEEAATLLARHMQKSRKGALNGDASRTAVGMTRLRRSTRSCAVAILLVAKIGCFERDFDASLSAKLVVPGEAMSHPEHRITRLEIHASSPDSEGLATVAEVRQHPLVFETRDPDVIRSLIVGAYDSLTGDCNPGQSSTILHVMAFDERTADIGYFRMYLCEGSADVAFMAYGDSGIGYSKTLRSLLQSLGLI